MSVSSELENVKRKVLELTPAGKMNVSLSAREPGGMFFKASNASSLAKTCESSHLVRSQWSDFFRIC